MLTPAIQRAIARVAILCLLTGLDSIQVSAQTPPADDLRIIIIDGDNFTNNIKRRTARDPVVEVRDRDNRRVPGAAVAFLLPENGASGTFLNGSRLLNVVTDQNGRAVATGLKPNSVAGKFQIRVTATSGGKSATTSIAQRNVKGGAALSAVTITLIAVAIVGAIIAAKLLTSGSAGKKTTISVGPPSLP